MKCRDLFELLAERAIVHPTWIEGASWRGRRLTIEVRGFRWWEDAHAEPHAQGTMSLVFDGMERGFLLTDEFDLDDDEALESFEVRSVADVPWAQAPDWSIYASGAISQPLALFGRLHDYLHSSSAFLTPDDFLNQAADLSRFAVMAQTTGFLVGRGPSCIRDLICDELDRQSVPHTVVETAADTEPALLVRLGNSAFLCERASAEFPG